MSKPETAYQESDRALQSLFTTGRYSDLVVICGDRTFRVHKAILCSRSPFFAKACEPDRFKEGVENSITLEAPSGDDDDDDDDEFEKDDPEAVYWMIRFLYFHTYDFGTAESGVSDTSPNNKSDNHTPEDDGKPSRRLSLHARLYALGEKYSIPTLKSMAAEKFLADAKSSSLSPSSSAIPPTTALDIDDFARAVKIAYQSTLDADDGLRKAVVTALAHHERSLAALPAVKKFIVETPELGYALWARAATVAAGPACLVCNTVSIKECPACTPVRCKPGFVVCKCQLATHCEAHSQKT